jgi:hypothetical protein
MYMYVCGHVYVHGVRVCVCVLVHVWLLTRQCEKECNIEIPGVLELSPPGTDYMLWFTFRYCIHCL